MPFQNSNVKDGVVAERAGEAGEKVQSRVGEYAIGISTIGGLERGNIREFESSVLICKDGVWWWRRWDCGCGRRERRGYNRSEWSES